MKREIAGGLGRWQFLRGKSAIYVEALRSWIMPASAVGAYVLYLTGSRRWSVIAAALVPIIGEGLGYILGRFLFNHGGVEAEYQMALDRDPYKRESLAELKRIRELLLAREWKPVIGHESQYEVSRTGIVRNAWGATPLKPYRSQGYLTVVLYGRRYKVHRLVAEAWIGPAPSDEHVVNHLDGNRQNNAVNNLEWATAKENTANAITRGTFHPWTYPGSRSRPRNNS